jgi:cytoskeleton protein RodZ
MPSFGEQIKRERELRKVSLKEIAEATKISVRFLRALEENDFSQLPGGVFDRGFVRAYAQFVGLDEEATVEAYLAERGPEQVVQRDDGLDALRNPAAAQSEVTPSDDGGTGSSRKLLWVAAVVVAVGLVSVSAWAVSRYFQGGEGTPEPPRQTSRVATQTVEEPPPEPEVAPVIEQERAPERRPEAEPEVEVVEQPAPPPAPPAEAKRETESEPKSSEPLIDARILIDRAAAGRINCDNRQIEMLDGLRPGTVLKLKCRRFLLLNVRDGGAVRVGLNGETPLQLSADGEPLDNYGIYP